MSLLMYKRHCCHNRVQGRHCIIHVYIKSVQNDREAMAQVIHEWVLKTDPVMPTWNNVADLIQYIGHFNLANSLRQVYVTGMVFYQSTV